MQGRSKGNVPAFALFLNITLTLKHYPIMLAAVSLCSASMVSYLNTPKKQFVLDLSGSSFMEVLKEYVKFKTKQNKRFTISSLLYNVNLIEKISKCTLDPEQITDEFYVLFANMLLARGLKPSTIETYCCQIRAALSWGMRHRCPVSSTFDQFNIPKYSKTKVWLTPSQISHIYYFEIEKNVKDKRAWERLKRVKDQLVLSACLGQRYSDLIRVEPSCFNEDRTVFKIVQQKTGNTAEVDMRTFAFDYKICREILERYNYYAPYPYDITDYNKALHKLLLLIGGEFLCPVKTENKIQGEIVVEEQPFYKMVSSHVGRRSFITINILRNMREAAIRKCSGHTDGGRSFGKYIIETRGRLM